MIFKFYVNKNYVLVDIRSELWYNICIEGVIKLKKIILNTDIEEAQNITIKNATLFGIREARYLDCEIIEHPINNNVSDFIIAPVKKIGYDFFFYDNEVKKYGKLSVKLRTTFFACVPVERVFIEKDYDTCYAALSKFTYTPITNCPFSFVPSGEDEISKYDMNLFGEYFGFVSEFGETKKWTQDAQGIIHLPFFEENRLYYDKVNIDESVYIAEWNKCWECLLNSNVYYKKSRELVNTTIKGVIIRNGEISQILSSKMPSLFKRTNEYYITKVDNGILSNYCSTDLLQFNVPNTVIYHDRDLEVEFSTDTEYTDKTVDVLHGFTLSFDNDVEEVYDILRVGGEIVNFYKY